MRNIFKAAILYKQKKPLKIINLELPTELEKGQVLVKIIYSGICGSQIGEIDGIKGKDKYLPHLLGHEGSGKVIKIGKGIKKFKIGDGVILHWKKNKGINAKTPTYKYKNSIINSGNITSFSEYSIISENRLTKVKNLAEKKISALFGCCLLTGFGVVKNDLKINPKDRVAIFGVGGLGLANIIYLKRIKPKMIIAIDINEKKLTKAMSLGANKKINILKLGKNEIVSFLKKNEINKIIENTGIIKNIEASYEGVSDKGKICLVGVPKHNQKARIHTLPIHFGKRIIGCHGGTNNPEKDIYHYISLFKKNNFRELETLVSKIGSLKNVNKAISQIRNSKIDARYVMKL